MVDERPRLPASEIEKLLLDALRRLPTLRNTQSVTIRPYSGPKGWSWELDSPGRWKQTPEAPDDLLWILGRADKLSDVRNDAIHALVLLHIGLGTVEMNVASPPRSKRERKLLDNAAKGKKLLDDFAKCARDVNALNTFVGRATRALAKPDRRKWPTPRPPQTW